MDLGEYVNVREAAKLINRKESLVRTLCQRGRFPGAVKVGVSWLIPRKEVLSYRPGKRGAKPKLLRRSEGIAIIQAALQENAKTQKTDG